MRKFEVTFTAVTDERGWWNPFSTIDGQGLVATTVAGLGLTVPSDATITELEVPFEPGYYRMVPSVESPNPPVVWCSRIPESVLYGIDYEKVEVSSKGVN